VEIHLKEIRLQTNHTIEQLAARSGVSAGYISKIENGMAVPTLTVLCRLAKALGVEPCVLFACNKHKEVAEVDRRAELMEEILAIVAKLSVLSLLRLRDCARALHKNE